MGQRDISIPASAPTFHFMHVGLETRDSEKTIFDVVKDGNAARLVALLTGACGDSRQALVDSQDDDVSPGASVDSFGVLLVGKTCQVLRA